MTQDEARAIIRDAAARAVLAVDEAVLEAAAGGQRWAFVIQAGPSAVDVVEDAPKVATAAAEDDDEPSRGDVVYAPSPAAAG